MTTDGNAYALAQHHDRPDPIGHEDGETCNRVELTDRTIPRGYRTKPCTGVMVQEYGDGTPLGDWFVCDTCGEIGD